MRFEYHWLLLAAGLVVVVVSVAVFEPMAN